MFDDKNLQKDDALSRRLERLSGQINPSPALKKAAKTGVPLRATGIRYTAGMHIRRVSKAVLAYAAGVAILLGGVFLLPKLFESSDPVVTQPSQTTTVAPNPETCEHEYKILSYDPENPCIDGPSDEYICELCGHRYTKSHPPLGHDFVDGVCTRCGETEEANPAWSLDQFGDPSVIETALARMGLTLDQFSAANLPKAKSFLGNDDLHGFLMSYYYNCEEISPMELYYTFGEKCRLSADELADLGISVDSLSMDCYRFTGEDAAALLTQYTAVQPTWVDEIRPMLIALGYPYRPDTFYSFVDSDYLAVKRIIVNGCGTAQSGEWIVFYETQEGDRCMVALLPDGNSYRFVANCPTDYLHHDVPPPPADCEHLQDPATCPYCNCDGHEFADNTCTKCGLVCEHEYSDVFPNGICTKCGTECNHVYNEDTCDGVCTLCGKRQGHDYKTVISTDRICTEGNLTTTTCSRCGYSYTETTPAKGHSYVSGACTVCGEKKKTVTVTDSKVAAGSVSLLPEQMYSIYPSLKGDGFYGLDPTTTPVFYNVYTYFEGYTITNIRLPIYRAEKGSVFTVRVMKTSNGINTDWVATYTLPLYIDREVSREWVLLSGFSIKVPEGCTLTFGWTSDTLELAMPTSGYFPGYSYRNDYAGSCGTAPLLIDVYGKKTTPLPTPDTCEHNSVITGQTPTCTEGCTVKYTCTKCGYSYEEWKDPVVHDYRNGACTMCGRAEAVVSAGSANLLLSERAYSISTTVKANYFALANSGAPYYFRSNYYRDPSALLEGSTVTDIRVAVLSANKGDTLTVSVVRMNGTIPGEILKTYVLTATENRTKDCLLFSGLSIKVPVGYILTFGAPDDTIELVYTDNTLLSHTFASTVRGEFENDYALMIDVYGVRDLDSTLNWMKKLGCPNNLLPNAVRPLNATEIAAARLFLNSDARWIITEETFFKPEDIRPYMLFYMENGTDRLSDGEFEALKAIRGDVVEWGDCSKMTDAELDAYLMQYMGIEMKPSMVGKGLYYLEEYDTYYFFATDANDIGISNLWGWLTEDGNYLLRSTAGYDDFAVLLKPTADGFLIQQVVWINDTIHWVD